MEQRMIGVAITIVVALCLVLGILKQLKQMSGKRTLARRRPRCGSVHVGAE